MRNNSNQRESPLHLLVACISRNLLLLSCLGTKSRFDRLEAAEIQPGTKKHDGEIEDAKRDENAKIEPLLGVEDVESLGLRFK